MDSSVTIGVRVAMGEPVRTGSIAVAVAEVAGVKVASGVRVLVPLGVRVGVRLGVAVKVTTGVRVVVALAVRVGVMLGVWVGEPDSVVPTKVMKVQLKGGREQLTVPAAYASAGLLKKREVLFW